MEVTLTDGGWVPKTARWPETTVDINVGQVRAIEFLADNPGDWPLHCHKSHHTMNAMGHHLPTMIGVDHRGIAQKIMKLVPDYMVMGERGMGDMSEMEMPLPVNTLPMMTGKGPFGPIDMGGMFTVFKIREGLAPNDYNDPGWYKHPVGTVAHEWTGATPAAPRASAEPRAIQTSAPTKEYRARKPSGHSAH